MESEHPLQNSDPMSFLDKVVNLFASPGELFEEIARTGITARNWLIPWLIYVLITIVTGQILVGNPSLSGQLESAMRKQFDQSVEKSIIAGDMTQEEAEQAFETFASPRSPWFSLMSAGGTLFLSLAILFLLGLIGWLLGRTAMNATAEFMKVVEVLGMVFIISGVEQVVTMALMLLTDSIYASPSLALLLLPDVNLEDRTHLALAKLNLFTFWIIALVSIGLGKLFYRDSLKVFALVAALWVLWSLFSILEGIGFGG
ncbi:MAG: YIP1 family protein [Ignavibacteria bacterium]|nr:YIP1 family protein [Ignavibacteria bacterium]